MNDQNRSASLDKVRAARSLVDSHGCYEYGDDGEPAEVEHPDDYFQRYWEAVAIIETARIMLPPRKAKISMKTKWFVFLRDNYTCKHCGSRQDLSIDHVIPESKGGSSDPDNLQTLCMRCNRIKGSKMGVVNE